MKNYDFRTVISHEEIEEATKFFFERGGKIKIFPEQKASSVNIVGLGKWIIFEDTGKLLY